MNTSIGQCNKADFRAFEKLPNGRYNLRWGRQGVLSRVYAYNEDTGKNEPTGEVVETDLCTYEYYQHKKELNHLILAELFEVAQRRASVTEYKEMLTGLGMEDVKELLRVRLKDNIVAYDISSNVNEFYVSGQPIWLDKATRAGLLLRFQAEQARDITDTALWYNGQQFPLKVDQAIQMLYAIELYASACYDNTQRHLAAIQALQTIEEIEAYDYTTGYPEKLRF